METGIVLLLAIVYLVVCAGAGAYVADQKGRGAGEGMIFGFAFGPLGLIVEACLPERLDREPLLERQPRDRKVDNVEVKEKLPQRPAASDAELTEEWERYLHAMEPEEDKKANQVLAEAKQIAAGSPNWAQLSSALFDPREGLVAKNYPHRPDRERFTRSRQYRAIKHLVEQVMEKAGAAHGTHS
jgi:hypothetical protein